MQVTFVLNLGGYMKDYYKTATTEEAKELRYVGIPRIHLRYLKDSKKKMGVALWDVLAPQLSNYPPNGGDNGFPTMSIEGLRKAGLL